MMLFFARLTNVGGEFLIFIRQNPNIIVSITVSQLYVALFSSSPVISHKSLRQKGFFQISKYHVIQAFQKYCIAL